MNAIELLEEQHEKTLKALEAASELEGKRERTAKMNEIADELIAHMLIEESIFYPRAAEALRDADLIGEAYEEHAVARFSLKRALAAVGEDDFKATVTVLKELIEHHIEEEEEELFPKVRKAIDAKELASLGVQMKERFDAAVEAGHGSTRITRANAVKAFRAASASA